MQDDSGKGVGSSGNTKAWLLGKRPQADGAVNDARVLAHLPWLMTGKFLPACAMARCCSVVSACRPLLPSAWRRQPTSRHSELPPSASAAAAAAAGTGKASVDATGHVHNRLHVAGTSQSSVQARQWGSQQLCSGRGSVRLEGAKAGHEHDG